MFDAIFLAKFCTSSVVAIWKVKLESTVKPSSEKKNIFSPKSSNVCAEKEVVL